MSMGADGLAQAANDAVLSANYILAGHSGDLTASYEGPCMHEVLFDDRFLADDGFAELCLHLLAALLEAIEYGFLFFGGSPTFHRPCSPFFSSPPTNRSFL